MNVVRAPNSLATARVTDQGNSSEVDCASKAEPKRGGCRLDSAVPAAQKLEVFENQPGTREVQAAVFDEGIARRTEVLWRAGGDSAIGVDRHHQVTPRGKLFRKVSVAFVVWSNHVVELGGRAAFARARAGTGE